MAIVSEPCRSRDLVTRSSTGAPSNCLGRQSSASRPRFKARSGSHGGDDHEGDREGHGGHAHQRRVGLGERLHSRDIDCSLVLQPSLARRYVGPAEGFGPQGTLTGRGRPFACGAHPYPAAVLITAAPANLGWRLYPLHEGDLVALVVLCAHTLSPVPGRPNLCQVGSQPAHG